MDIKDYIQSGIIESHVLGLANEQESAELLKYCNQYPEVKKAVEDFEVSLEKEAFENAVAPFAGIKSNLLKQLADEFAEERDNKQAPVIPISSEEQIITTSYKFWKFLAAATILLFVASAGLNIYYYNNYQSVNNNYQALLVEKNSLQANNDIFKTRTNELDESMRLMSDTAMKVVKMMSVKNTNDMATIYWDTKTKDVYLLQNSLPQTPEDKQYQLWAIVDGKPVDAGMIDHCTGLCKLKNIPSAQAFAVTLEKRGGSPTPTMTAMYVMGKV